MSGINSYNDLEKWFSSQPNTFWVVYRGHIKNKRGAAKVAQNDNEGSKEEAFYLLESSLKLQTSGGRFTVMTTEKPGGNGGIFETYFTMDKPVHQISGVPTVSGLPLGVNSLDDYKKQLKKEWDDQQEKEELYGRIEALENSTPMERIGNTVMDSLFGNEVLINACIGKILGIDTSSISIQGLNENINTEVEEEFEPTPEEISMIIQDAFKRLSVHFKDPIITMQKLVRWVEANPALAKSLILTI